MNKQKIEKAIETLKAYMPNESFFHTEERERFDLAISTLQQQLNNGWIPVNEKLPDGDYPVIVTARRNDGARGYWCNNVQQCS